MDERDLLSQWKINATLANSFNSGVWRRIESTRQPTFGELFAAWLTTVFARPAVAGAYTVIALAIGLLAGNLHASNVTHRTQAQLETRYIQSVDPYSKPLHQ